MRSSGCGVYYLAEGQQLGCTATSCQAYSAPYSGQLYSCSSTTCAAINSDSAASVSNSIISVTRDTDLQQAQLQQQHAQAQAQAISQQFGMSFDSASQLAVLANEMQELTANGQALTDEDRAALTSAALDVAGISGDEVNAAASKMIQTGDQSSVDALLEKAADNLGMSSSAALKDQILPSLGIHIN